MSALLSYMPTLITSVREPHLRAIFGVFKHQPPFAGAKLFNLIQPGISTEVAA
ncbi:MAG TPA: hypothetical protein VFD30_19405 [Terriglobia bacterium]|nr:hypothetical protein [Terriglobia bacterium]